MGPKTGWVAVVLIVAGLWSAGCTRSTGEFEAQSVAPEARGFAGGAPGFAGGPPGAFGPAFGGGPAGAAQAVLDTAGEDSGAPVARLIASGSETAAQANRYLIRDGSLTLEVDDAKQAAEEIGAAVRGAGGYLSDTSEAADGYGQRRVVLQARMPVGRFDDTLARIEALGKVIEKQIAANDVTEEFVDAQSRLRNLQRTEARLLDHLQRTGKLADTLLIEKELTRVRGEIEQLEGRLRFLQHRVAFSTVRVTLQEAAAPRGIAPVDSYSSGQVMAAATRSLVMFGRAVWTVVIWLGIWAIVWLPIALGIWYALRRRPGARSSDAWRPAAGD